MSRRSRLRGLFEDRSTGRIVVGQSPNALFLCACAATIAQRVASASVTPKSGTPASILALVARGTLGLWALDEAARGVNPFRRAGGALVLAAVLWRAGRR